MKLTSGNGSITAAVGAVVDGATGGTFGTENGDIDLRMPSTGNYALQATATNTVDFGTPPSGCMENAAAPNSKTLSCGTAMPNFVVDAQGPGGTVTVAY